MTLVFPHLCLRFRLRLSNNIRDPKRAAAIVYVRYLLHPPPHSHTLSHTRTYIRTRTHILILTRILIPTPVHAHDQNARALEGTTVLAAVVHRVQPYPLLVLRHFSTARTQRSFQASQPQTGRRIRIRPRFQGTFGNIVLLIVMGRGDGEVGIRLLRGIAFGLTGRLTKRGVVPLGLGPGL